MYKRAKVLLTTHKLVAHKNTTVHVWITAQIVYIIIFGRVIVHVASYEWNE